MKAKNYYLISEVVRDNAIKTINDALLDGKTKVSVGSAGSKSARQRGLQWIWYEDTAKSGIGGEMEETAKGVSLIAKEMFALPIIFRNPEKYEMFIDLCDSVRGIYWGDEVKFYKFLDNYCHTEWFDTQEMAEFLTDYMTYYTTHGVTLSDPIDYKLLNR